MHKNQIIHTDDAPKAIGPYSQAVKLGEWVFVSGQIALDPRTGEIHGATSTDQAKQCLRNLKAILLSAGAEPKDVLKCTIYLKNMDDFPQVNEVYGEFFHEPYPARATVEVSRLPKDVLVEIDAIAHVLSGE
ncbi:MAG: RidA family protein [Planctomycetes bacterium]|nr:RidA family protein [Planctomycetota bacterium]